MLCLKIAPDTEDLCVCMQGLCSDGQVPTETIEACLAK